MLMFMAGLFLFLLGLEGSKRGLSSAASKRAKVLIKRFSNNLFLSILTGAIVTAILQSSSGVTVIVISLIEAGLLSLKPALGIIMGANIGTTLTVQIVSFPVLDAAPYLIIAGVFFMLISFYYKPLLGPGLSVASFGIVFQGLNLMTGYFKQPEIIKLLSRFLIWSEKHLIMAVVIGFIITAIIQSSSVVTGITVSLAYSGTITLPVAVAIALGSNIGTCITGFIASLRTGQGGKTLALGHFWFNLVGVLMIFPFFNIFLKLIFLTSNSLVRQIANAHTIFNIFNVFVFIPFFDTFVSLIGGKRNGSY